MPCLVPAPERTAVVREGQLLPYLVDWLRRTRRISDAAVLATELAWMGRRVDLATMTATKRTSAYELKLGRLGRALEQASYNRVAFDRSYVVTDAVPRSVNLELAAKEEIGVIVVLDGVVKCLLESPLRRPIPQLRTRLLAKLSERADARV